MDKGIFLLHYEESGAFVDAWSRIPVGRYQGRDIVGEEFFCNMRGMCGFWCSEGGWRGWEGCWGRTCCCVGCKREGERGGKTSFYRKGIPDKDANLGDHRELLYLTAKHEFDFE